MEVEKIGWEWASQLPIIYNTPIHQYTNGASSKTRTSSRMPPIAALAVPWPQVLHQWPEGKGVKAPGHKDHKRWHPEQMHSRILAQSHFFAMFEMQQSGHDRSALQAWAHHTSCGMRPSLRAIFNVKPTSSKVRSIPGGEDSSNKGIRAIAVQAAKGQVMHNLLATFCTKMHSSHLLLHL